MDRELTRAELDELLPLFALDALEGEEHEQVARYVARDAEARAEVDSLREAAAFLPCEPRPAPAALWEGIEHALRAPAPVAPGLERPAEPVWLAGTRPGEARASRRGRVFAMAAAVVVLLAISVSAVLGIKVAQQQDRIDALAAEMHRDTVVREAEMAMTLPGAHRAVLDVSSGDAAAEVVMLPDGSGWFVHSDLGALPADRTYQLWAMVDDGAGATRYVSVGVLGAEPGPFTFRAAAPVTGFVVSEEPAGGAETPGTMVAQGSMA